MRQNCYKFGCDLSIKKDTLLVLHSNFFAASPSLQVDTMKLKIYHLLRIPQNCYKFGCDLSMKKDNLLVLHSTFFAASRLLFK
jgi:hypothetical protein